MAKSTRDDAVPFGPGEKVTGALAFATVAATTWALAGKAGPAPAIYTSLSVVTALASVLLAWKDGRALHRTAFLPFLIFGAVVAVSCCNLSYNPVAGEPGKWLSRDDWIKWLPSTVDRATTLREMLPWLSALLLGGALRQAALGRRAVRWLWGALLVHGLLVAVVGGWFYFHDNSMVLGLYRDRHGYHFASFVYRNHWAAYVIVLVAVSLGFAFSALRRWRTERGSLDGVLPGIGVALLIAFTLPMPGTRSGIVVAGGMLAVAFVWLGWVLWTARAARKTAVPRWVPPVVLAVFLAAAIGVGVSLNQEGIQKHWRRTQSQIRHFSHLDEDLRWNLSRDTVRMAADRPVWGWGVGSFGLLFSKYQGDYLRDEQGRPTARVVNAHNDWAHMWAETGVIGMLVLVIPLVWLLRACWRSRGVLARWGGAGVCLILAYALVEFPLHCAAVLFLWMTVLCTAAPAVEAAGGRRRAAKGTGRRPGGRGRKTEAEQPVSGSAEAT